MLKGRHVLTVQNVGLPSCGPSLNATPRPRDARQVMDPSIQTTSFRQEALQGYDRADKGAE
jgi:hypothetical protein